MPVFNIGKLMMTRAVNETIAANEAFAKEILSALRRYISADWGDLGKDDKELNDSALSTGLDRIVAAYSTSEGKIYIITEHDRTYTTILFSSEY